MPEELGSRTITPFKAAPATKARFRVYRVVCPRCGHAFWFTLFSERSAEEVARAMAINQERLLRESCERHAGVCRRTA